MLSMSYEDDPLGDWQQTQGHRTDTVLPRPEDKPLLRGVSESNLLLLRLTVYGIVLLAVLCTGWVVFTVERV